MDVPELRDCEWYTALEADVGGAIAQLVQDIARMAPELQQERDNLQQQINGWKVSLGDPALADIVRRDIEQDYNRALERIQQIDNQLSEEGNRHAYYQSLLDPIPAAKRLTRLEKALAGDNVADINVELMLHIDKIVCDSKGRVELRTCRLGSFPELAEVLKSDEPECTAGNADDANCGVARTVPRRRSKRQVDSFGDVELAKDVHRALDPDRFTGLDDNWFWMDEFAIPIELPWFMQHAEKVFQRRQQAKLSLSKLANEFSVSRPTIKRALEHYLNEHPEARDDVNLSRGGQRPPKFDLSQFGKEARELWEKGWSKLKLAEKFGCSTPTIDKALKWAYAQDGLPLPTRKERQAAKIAHARALLDDGQSLEEIARQLNVSDVTARQYLRTSFMAEGKPMPDLRRRDSQR